METILTVLITLGVVALVAAVWGVIRLNKRVDDLDLIRMELVDLEDTLEKRLDHEIDKRETHHDQIWSDIHKLKKRVKELDKTINPNMDLIN